MFMLFYMYNLSKVQFYVWLAEKFARNIEYMVLIHWVKDVEEKACRSKVFGSAKSLICRFNLKKKVHWDYAKEYMIATRVYEHLKKCHGIIFYSFIVCFMRLWCQWFLAINCFQALLKLRYQDIW